MRTINIDGRTLQIAAISLDLDDTLWPIAPTIERAEACLHAWFETHFPAVARAYPVAVMRALREQIWLENPALQHDFTTTRLLSLRVAMLPFGAVEADVQVAFELFLAARHDVTLFPGALASLQSLAAHWPVVALTNGNADLSRAAELLKAMQAVTDGAQWSDLNWQFHAALYAPAQRARLLGLIKMLHINSDRYMRPQQFEPSAQARSLAEHQQLLDDCWQRDSASATQTLRLHLERAAVALVTYLKQRASPPSSQSSD